MSLRVLDPNDESDDPGDASSCPYCGTLLGDFSEDMEFGDDSAKIVKVDKCPKCGKEIALVAEASGGVSAPPGIVFYPYNTAYMFSTIAALAIFIVGVVITAIGVQMDF